MQNKCLWNPPIDTAGPSHVAASFWLQAFPSPSRKPLSNPPPLSSTSYYTVLLDCTTGVRGGCLLNLQDQKSEGERKSIASQKWNYYNYLGAKKEVITSQTRENNYLLSLLLLILILLLLAWSKLIDLWKINWSEINISKSCNHWMQS